MAGSDHRPVGREREESAAKERYLGENKRREEDVGFILPVVSLSLALPSAGFLSLVSVPAMRARVPYGRLYVGVCFDFS